MTKSITLLLLAPLLLAGAALAQMGVNIKQLDDRLRVEIDGRLFTEYHFKDVPKPFFYPIIGPGNASMTRNYPMQDLGNETKDHPHHKGLYYGHGSVNGENFWAEQAPGAGRTVHVRFEEITSGPKVGTIRSQNRIVAADERIIGTDTRTIRIHRTSDGPMLDFDITHHASNGTIIFDDTKEGTFAIRVAETMVHSHPRTGRYKTDRPDEGHIVNSNGARGGDAWGQRAAWVDYYGPVDGKTVGIAIFDHPSNPRYPTWWHARTYGLFTANPFGVHDFEGLENPRAGEFTIPAGKSATFRYRIYIHAGDEKAARVAEHYKEYAAAK